MKIVFASSRTASNKRKICQQKIDFDISASTNKLQLISGNILITLENGFVCYFYNFGLLIRVIYCGYFTRESDRVASLSCLSVHPFPLSFYLSITACVYWLVTWELATLYREKLIDPKTLWTRDKIGNEEEIPRNMTSCCPRTDDSMVQKNAQNHKVLEW